MSVVEGQLLWTPNASFAARSNITAYMEWLRRERGLDHADYDALWRWSVDDLEGFWSSLWSYFDVVADGTMQRLLQRPSMEQARWFEGVRVNYAEHLLRYEARAQPGETAIHHLTESQPLAQLSWQQLGAQVRQVATQFRALGLQPGDRVVSYLPNVPETTVAMLATLAIGAVWSAAAPEFGTRTVIERFAQIGDGLLLRGARLGQGLFMNLALLPQ